MRNWGNLGMKSGRRDGVLNILNAGMVLALFGGLLGRWFVPSSPVKLVSFVVFAFLLLWSYLLQTRSGLKGLSDAICAPAEAIFTTRADYIPLEDHALFWLFVLILTALGGVIIDLSPYYLVTGLIAFFICRLALAERHVENLKSALKQVELRVDKLEDPF